MVLLMTYIRPPRKEGSDRNKFIGWLEVPYSIVGDFYMFIYYVLHLKGGCYNAAEMGEVVGKDLKIGRR